MHRLVTIAAVACAAAYTPTQVGRRTITRRTSRPVMLAGVVADIEAKIARLQSPAQLQQQIDALESQLNELVDLKKQEIAAMEDQVAEVAKLKQEVSQLASTPVSEQVAAAAQEAPVIVGVPEQVAAVVQEVPAIVTPPAQDMMAIAAQAAPTAVQEFAQTPSVIQTMQPAAEAAAAVSLSANDAASIPWAAFAFAFTVFPTAVIVISETMTNPPSVEPSAPKPVDKSAVSIEGEGRNAKDILAVALTNLGKEPTGWFFGKPSALYSNVPLPATPPPSESLAGIVTPTGVPKETPQERAARERAEMTAEGKQL